MLFSFPGSCCGWPLFNQRRGEGSSRTRVQLAALGLPYPQRPHEISVCPTVPNAVQQHCRSRYTSGSPRTGSVVPITPASEPAELLVGEREIWHPAYVRSPILHLVHFVLKAQSELNEEISSCPKHSALDRRNLYKFKKYNNLIIMGVLLRKRKGVNFKRHHKGILYKQPITGPQVDWSPVEKNPGHFSWLANFNGLVPSNSQEKVGKDGKT